MLDLTQLISMTARTMPKKTPKPKPRYDGWNYAQAISSGSPNDGFTPDDRKQLFTCSAHTIPGLESVINELEIHKTWMMANLTMQEPTNSEIVVTLQDLASSAETLCSKLEHLDEITADFLTCELVRVEELNPSTNLKEVAYVFESNIPLKKVLLIDQLKHLTDLATKQSTLLAANTHKGRPVDQGVSTIIHDVARRFQKHGIPISTSREQPFCTFLEELFQVLGREKIDVQNHVRRLKKMMPNGMFENLYFFREQFRQEAERHKKATLPSDPSA